MGGSRKGAQNWIPHQRINVAGLPMSVMPGWEGTGFAIKKRVDVFIWRRAASIRLTAVREACLSALSSPLTAPPLS